MWNVADITQLAVEQMLRQCGILWDDLCLTVIPSDRITDLSGRSTQLAFVTMG
jgi:hypothetical protein